MLHRWSVSLEKSFSNVKYLLRLESIPCNGTIDWECLRLQKFIIHWRTPLEGRVWFVSGLLQGKKIYGYQNFSKIYGYSISLAFKMLCTCWLQQLHVEIRNIWIIKLFVYSTNLKQKPFSHQKYGVFYWFVRLFVSFGIRIHDPEWTFYQFGIL